MIFFIGLYLILQNNKFSGYRLWAIDYDEFISSHYKTNPNAVCETARLSIKKALLDGMPF
jgi:hypothetical protein